MEHPAPSPNSGGKLSPLRVSGARAHAAMQNVALEATVPKIPPLPLPPSDSESSHGDTSDGDFVLSDQSTDSAVTSPKKTSHLKSPAKHCHLKSPAKHYGSAPVSNKSSLASPASLCSPASGAAGLTFSETLSSLIRSQNRACTWPSGPIHIDLCLSLSDNTTVAVDIVPTLGHKKNPPRKRDDENSYFLPHHLNKNEPEFRKKFIYPLLIKACAKAGFNGWCHYQFIKSSTIPKIRVVCHRSRKHDEILNKKTNTKVKYAQKSTVKKGKRVGPRAKDTRRPV